MTDLRVVLFAAAGALGLAAAGAGLAPAWRSGGPAHRGAHSTTTPRATPTSTSTTTTMSTIGPAPATVPTSATLAAAKPAPDLRDVPPSILSRAADARALDRAAGGACRPHARADSSTCAPRRDTVEIRWDVGKEP
jgi:hypothetical protein